MPLASHSARVRVPATTANLGPGFDCLGLALQLYNEVELCALEAPGLKVETTGLASCEQMPRDTGNLVFRAASRVFNLAGSRPSGLALRLVVNTPLSRGLGSSASAIAGGMTAANALLGDPIPEDVLLREMVLMEKHPDNIAACLYGGLTASVMAEDRVLVRKYEPCAALRCVVLIPDYELATAKARLSIPRSVPLRDAVFNLGRIPFVIDKLTSGDLEDLSRVMDDRLHQPYRKSLVCGFDSIVSEAENAGAAAMCLSGAGPAMVAFTTEPFAEPVARTVRKVMRELAIGCRVAVCAADNEGVRKL